VNNSIYSRHKPIILQRFSDGKSHGGRPAIGSQAGVAACQPIAAHLQFVHPKKIVDNPPYTVQHIPRTNNNCSREIDDRPIFVAIVQP